MNTSPLAPAFVTLSGEDRFSFLQSLISSDTTPLKEDFVVWSNLLSPQGRILFNFLIIPIGEGLWITLPSSQVQDLHKALSSFLVKEKVRIATNFIIHTNISFPSHPPSQPLGKVWRENHTVSFRDPRSPLLGVRSLQPNPSPPSSLTALYTWQCYRLGIVENITSLDGRKLLPLEAAHHLFQAIGFEKGCFVGQEVNMRLFRRGVIKRIILGASSQKNMDAPLPLNAPLSFPHDPSLKGRIVTSLLNSSHMWAGLILIEGTLTEGTLTEGTLTEGTIKDTSSFISALSHDTLLTLSPSLSSQEQNHG